MPNRLRLSLLISNLRGGGAERVAVRLANGFYFRGFAVEVVLLENCGEFLPDLNPRIPIIDLKSSRLRFSFFPVLSYLRRRKPNALLVFMWPLTVIAILASLLSRTRTRIVVSEHTTWSKDPLAYSFLTKWCLKLTIHFLFPHASAVVSVSRGAAEDLARLAGIDPAAIKVIYNPITSLAHELNDVPHAPDEWWSGDHRRVLAVGALKPVKDYATLISAFKHLLERVESRLLILGEGECRSELENQVKALGLERHVFIPGFTRVLLPYYYRSHLFVLSSSVEGFGNVIVEALECGTPVVSTDCQSGPREILLNGKYGVLVPVGDSLALSLAMLSSLSSSHNPVALRDRARDFSVEKAVTCYLEVLFPSMNHSESV